MSFGFSICDLVGTVSLCLHVLQTFNRYEEVSHQCKLLNDELSNLKIVLSSVQSIFSKDTQLADRFEPAVTECQRNLDQLKLICERFDGDPRSRLKEGTYGICRNSTTWKEIPSRILSNSHSVFSSLGLIAMSASMTDRMLLIPKVFQYRECDILAKKTQWNNNAWKACFYNSYRIPC